MNAADWDERYRAATTHRHGRVWSSDPQQVVQELVQDLTPGSALDLGAGDGRNSVFLAQAGWEVTAVDFSAEGIRLARQRAEKVGVAATWLVADARSYAPDREFDLVIATYLHLSEAESRAVLSAAATWVAPGGHLLVLGHDKANLEAGAPGPSDPDVLYTPELLASCAVGLAIERCERLFRDAGSDPEGPDDSAATAVDTLLFASRPASA
jgi:SAM-dependent methyltransferase